MPLVVNFFFFASKDIKVFILLLENVPNRPNQPVDYKIISMKIHISLIASLTFLLIRY
jgi:hypothetical protein